MLMQMQISQCQIISRNPLFILNLTITSQRIHIQLLLIVNSSTVVHNRITVRTVLVLQQTRIHLKQSRLQTNILLALTIHYLRQSLFQQISPLLVKRKNLTVQLKFHRRFFKNLTNGSPSLHKTVKSISLIQLQLQLTRSHSHQTIRNIHLLSLQIYIRIFLQ